jgi:hypothetical protein
MPYGEEPGGIGLVGIGTGVPTGVAVATGVGLGGGGGMVAAGVAVAVAAGWSRDPPSARATCHTPPTPSPVVSPGWLSPT